MKKRFTGESACFRRRQKSHQQSHQAYQWCYHWLPLKCRVDWFFKYLKTFYQIQQISRLEKRDSLFEVRKVSVWGTVVIDDYWRVERIGLWKWKEFTSWESQSDWNSEFFGKSFLPIAIRRLAGFWRKNWVYKDAQIMRSSFKINRLLIGEFRYIHRGTNGHSATLYASLTTFRIDRVAYWYI